MLKNAKEEKTAQEKKMIQYYPLNFYHYLCWFSSAIINQHLRCIIMKGNTNYIKESLKKKKRLTITCPPMLNKISSFSLNNVHGQERTLPHLNPLEFKKIFFRPFFFFFRIIKLIK